MGFFTKRPKVKNANEDTTISYADRMAIAVLNAASSLPGTDPMIVQDLDTPHGTIKNVLLHGISKLRVHSGSMTWKNTRSDSYVRFKTVDSSEAFITAKYNLWFGEGDMKVVLRDLRLTLIARIDHLTFEVKLLSVTVNNLGKMKVQLKGMAKLFTSQFEKQLEEFRPYVIDVFREAALDQLNNQQWTIEMPRPE